MQHWMCITCGTQFAASESQPETCPICADQRQYIGPGGQKWITLEAMQGGNYKNTFKEYEPNVTGIGTEPTFAIGQRALLVQTGHGNVLWDCISYVDDETVAALQQRGGLKAIAISHPHFFTTACASRVLSRRMRKTLCCAQRTDIFVLCRNDCSALIKQGCKGCNPLPGTLFGE